VVVSGAWHSVDIHCCSTLVALPSLNSSCQLPVTVLSAGVIIFYAKFLLSGPGLAGDVAWLPWSYRDIAWWPWGRGLVALGYYSVGMCYELIW